MFYFILITKPTEILSPHLSFMKFRNFIKYKITLRYKQKHGGENIIYLLFYVGTVVIEMALLLERDFGIYYLKV